MLYRLCVSFRQLHKVNAFYMERIDELKSRLKVLVESVVEEFAAQVGTPLTHRRKRSLAENLVARFSRGVHHERNSSLPDPSLYMKAVSIPHESTRESDLSGDPSIEDQSALEGDEYCAKLKASDSIQRAMTDMYRTAKLLHNFAVMNYTGFVKIIKKHDKALKEFKGKYKDFTVESAVCNGGKDVEKQEERMVRDLKTYVSTWSLSESHLSISLSTCRRKDCTQIGSAMDIYWKHGRSSYRSEAMGFRWTGLSYGKCCGRAFCFEALLRYRLTHMNLVDFF